jgi:hypothetical protein
MKDLIFIFSILIIYSCNSKKEITRDLILNVTKSHLGDEEYNNLLIAATDTIDKWTTTFQKKFTRRKLDSVFCINNEKNKAVFAELLISLNSPFDDLIYLYAVKIKNKWYFFGGPAAIIPRYEESSFEKLQNAALEAIYKGYLYEDDNGKLRINESFFDHFTDNSWRSRTGVRPWDKESWEQLWLETAAKNWSEIDSTDYSTEN